MKIKVEILLSLISFYRSNAFYSRNFALQKYYRPLQNRLASLADDSLPDGFIIDPELKNRPPKPKQPISVSNISQLKDLIYQGYRVEDLDVRGNTTRDASVIHPVVQALYRRKEMKILPTSSPYREDGFKIALAIEGGGMRGCVAAGMVSALPYLGLEDTVDVVYGSSAGSLVGAYFIGRQLPHFGPEVYYDVLTSAGKEFIDAQAILRSCGLGLLDIRLDSLKSLYKDRIGKPVLSLDYLMDVIVKKIKPLDWDIFWHKQEENTQVLKVVASGLLSRKAVVMSAEKKNFQTLAELTECMRASMLLPGVTGEVVRLKGSQAEGDNIEKTWWREWSNRQNSRLIPGGEPMSDAVIFEPIPYRSALKENCTHIIAVRTRADNVSVTVRMSLVEKLIMSRFFGRKQGMPDLVNWMLNSYHKLVYAEDMLLLNECNRENDFDSKDPKIMCIALPAGTKAEVKRFETSRAVIFDSVRQGFAAAYDTLVQDNDLKGKGWEKALEVYPDSILEQLPAHILLQMQKNENEVNGIVSEFDEELRKEAKPEVKTEIISDIKTNIKNLKDDSFRSFFSNELNEKDAKERNEIYDKDFDLQDGEESSEEDKEEEIEEKKREEKEEQDENDFVLWLDSIEGEELVR
jgi:predicted patatin/cPLA2 family phospholipase